MLAKDDSRSGTIELGDIDTYTFFASSGDSIQVRLADVNKSTFFPSLFIYGPDGTNVAQAEGYTVAAIRHYSIEKTGTYTVIVTAGHANGLTDTTGSYVLHFAQMAGANELGMLAKDDSRSGTIELGDIDTYTFFASSGDSIQVRLADVNKSTFFPSLFIYGPDGTNVAQAEGYTVAAIRHYSIEKTGTYTVIVTAGHANGLTDTTGSYVLHFAQMAGANELGMLAENDSRSGTISIGDIDSYTFILSEPGSISLTVTDQSNSDFFPSIQLYSPDGTLLKSDGGYTSAGFSNYSLNDLGEYTIVITAGHANGLTDTSGAYKLDVSIAGIREIFSYVALGDSYSSGEGNLPFIGDYGVDWGYQEGCNRSYFAYSQFIHTPSNPIPISLRDDDTIFNFFACTGAVTTNINENGEGQYGELPQAVNSQINATNNLITISIGGNDAQFAWLLLYCLIHDHCNDLKPFDPHSDLTLGDLFTVWAQVVKLNLLETFSELRAKAPNATIIAIDYPLVVSGNECDRAQIDSDMNLSADEQSWMRDANRLVNSIVQEAAEITGIHSVSVEEHFEGHGVCGDEGEWIYGTWHFWRKGMFHPNPIGQIQYARIINNYLDSISTGWSEGYFEHGLPRNPEPKEQSESLTTQVFDSFPNFGDLTVEFSNPVESCTHVEPVLVPGQSYRIVGANFAPNEPIDISLKADLQNVALESINANEDGVLDAVISIPETVTVGTRAFIQAVAEGENGQGLILIAVLDMVDSIVLDADQDGVPDGCDNCLNTINTDQLDSDFDGIGDVCDVCFNDPLNDEDGDGMCAFEDICPLDPNNDIDNDGICAELDNCPLVPNIEQGDSDFNLVGDACDNGGIEDDLFITDEDTVLTLDVLNNDENGDSLVVSSYTQPGHGTVSSESDSLLYTPFTDYFGEDSFTYTVKEDDLEIGTATVYITVNPINDLPVVTVSGTFSISEFVEASLNAEVSDVDSDTFTFQWSEVNTSVLSLVNTESDNVSLSTPFVDSETSVEISVLVSDGQDITETVVELIIQNDNQAPTVSLSSPSSVNEGDSVTITAAVADAENHDLVLYWQQKSGPEVVFSNSENSLNFTAPEVTGNDTVVFEITVSDPELSTTELVSISVQDTDRNRKSGGSFGWLTLFFLLMAFITKYKSKIVKQFNQMNNY